MNAPDPTHFWFHCGRCGSFFRAAIDDGQRRVCADCGQDPSHDQWRASMIGANLPVHRNEGQEGSGSPVVVRTRRRSKRTVLIVFLLWVSFFGFLVWLAHSFGEDQAERESTAEIDPELEERFALDGEFLKVHLPQVYAVFAGYAVSATHEERSQFVMDPIRVIPRMDRYFMQNPLIRVDPASLRRRASSVISVDAGKAVEVLWQSGEDVYETVFFRDDAGEWKLDWEDFVRDSDMLFSLFLAGGGPDDAEFRLYARERLAEDREREPEASLTLYSPVIGKPRKVGISSPEILVPREGEIGRTLSAAFRMRREGKRPFDSYLPNFDSEDLIRVRVRLRRHENEEGEKHFELVELLACHWGGVVGEMGVEADPPTKKEEMPEGEE